MFLFGLILGEIAFSNGIDSDPEISEQVSTDSSWMFGNSWECQSGIWVPTDSYNDDDIPGGCPGTPGIIPPGVNPALLHTGEDFVVRGIDMVFEILSELC